MSNPLKLQILFVGSVSLCLWHAVKSVGWLLPTRLTGTTLVTLVLMLDTKLCVWHDVKSVGWLVQPV